MIEAASLIALGMVGAAAILLMARMIMSRTLADAMVALDALLLAFVSGIAIQAARTGQDTFLNVMVVAALLAFVGTALVARFIRRRGN
jgi:multicomponent Na+:H+ antiporter subunit F